MTQHDLHDGERATRTGQEGLAALDAWLDEPTRPSGTFLLTRETTGRGAGRASVPASWCARMREEGDLVAALRVAKGEPVEAAAQRLASVIEALIPGFEDRMAAPERRLPELLERLAKRHLAPPSRRLLLVIEGLEGLRARDAEDTPLARLLPHSPPRGVFVIAALAADCPWVRWFSGPARVATATLGEGAWSLDDVEDEVALGPGCEAVEAVSEALEGADWARIWAAALEMVQAPGAAGQEGRVRAALAEVLEAAPTPVAAEQARDLLCAWSTAGAAILREPGATRALLFDRLLDRGWAPEAIEAGLDAGARPRLTRLLPLGNRDRSLRALWGHGSKVMSVAFSADGALLASGGEDGAVLLWSVAHERSIRALCGHSKAVTSVCFLRDGRLASASEDGRVLLWDVDAGATVRTLAGGDGGVEAIAVTGDETGLLAATDAGSLVFWELATGRRRWAVEASEVGLTSCALSEDGLYALSGAYDKSVRVWSLVDGAPVRSMRGAPRYAVSGVATAEGLVVASTHDNSLWVWSLVDGAEVATLEGHGSWVTGVALETGGRRALSCSRDRTLRLWRLPQAGAAGEVAGAEEMCLLGHVAMVNKCAIAPGGGLAASGSADRSVRLWRLPTGAGVAPPLGHEGAIRACLFGREGEVLTASEDSTARSWSPTRGVELRRFSEHLHGVTSLALSADGSRLITGSLDRSIRVWQTRGEAEGATALFGHSQGVSALALREDGALLASGSIDGSLKLWALAAGEAAVGRELRGLSGHEGGVFCCVFDGTGRLISGGQDGMIRVWDPESGAELMTLAGHEGAVLGLALGLAGERLFSAGADGTLRAWDLRRGRGRGLVGRHEGAVNGCALCEDEGLLLSVGADGWLRLWDPEQRLCVASNWGESALRCVAVAGEQALVGDHGGSWWMVRV